MRQLPATFISPQLTPASPPGPTFIPELDDLILSARPHLGGSSLLRGDLVELIGPSGSGKTTVATFFLLTALLPSSLDLASANVPVGGRGMYAALLCPSSHAPPVPFLAATMRAHVERCFAAADISTLPDAQSPEVQAAIGRVVDTALSRLVVLRPRPRAPHWAMALRRILTPPATLRGQEGTQWAPALIVCDGFGDGFWPERWVEEEGGRRGGGGTGLRKPEDASMRDVWEALTALRSELGAVVVITLQGLRSIPNSPFFKPHLPPPYPSLYAPHTSPDSSAWPLNIQLTLLGPSRPLQLPAETTLAEALQGRTSKDVRVYNAIVRVPGGSGTVGSAGGGRFSFGVHEYGLVPFNAQ